MDEAVKKVHSRLYRSRKPRSFDVREDILHMFYTVTISGMTCRGENAPKQALHGHENNIAQPKADKCLSSTSHFSPFNRCLSFGL